VKNKSKVLGLSLLGLCLASCSQMPHATLDPQDTVAAKGASESVVSEEKQVPTMPPLSLTPESMFDVMVAEMLAQRGEAEAAYAVMIRAAEKTRDVQLVERAFNLAMSAFLAEGIERSAALWRELSPKDSTPWRVGYLMALRAGSLEQAVEFWQTYRQLSNLTLEEDLKNAAAQVSQTVEAKNGLAFFERLSQNDPQEWSSVYAYSFVADRYGEVELAVQLLEGLVARLSVPRDVYFALANLYIENDLTERGLQGLASYVQANPADWMMQERYARLEVKAERYNQAVLRYEQVVEANPEAYTSILSLGLLKLELGESEEAKGYLEKLLGIEGYQQVSLYYLGAQAQAEKDWSRALSYLQQVAHPNYRLDANLLIADILYSTEGLRSALNQLQTLNPADDEELIKVLRAQGVFNSQAGQWTAAVEAYRAAFALAPDNVTIAFSLAMALYETKAFDEYEALVKEMVFRYPDEPDALNALGYFYVEQNRDLDEAERLLERALQIDPTRYHIIDSRGWLEYVRGNYVAAEKYLQQAWLLRQDDEVFVHLMKTLWAQKKFEQARAFWLEFHGNFPQSGGAQEILKQLEAQMR